MSDFIFCVLFGATDSTTMADSPTDIDVVFAFKRQNVAKERFYSVVHSPPPTWFRTSALPAS